MSEIQQYYVEGLKLQRKPNINSWNSSIITFLLEYSQALWKFRSEIHHSEATLTQETMLREQAVSLLLSLRTTPHRIPHHLRNLLTRTSDFLRSTQIHNVTSWTNRINQALEDQQFSEKSTSMDIRTWMYSGSLSAKAACTRVKSDDTWYDPHAYDTDDSDLTINYCHKFPDEGDNTWINCDSMRGNCRPVNNALIAPK